MKKFFSAIGRFLKANYWLPPLLLVAVVFILVFSLQGLDGAINSVRSWISPNSRCSECKIVKVKDATEDLQKATPEDPVYVLLYEKNCEACDNVYKNLNNFIKHNDIEVLAINIGVKEYYTIGTETEDPKVFQDKTMTLENYRFIGEDIRKFLLENGAEIVTSTPNSYTPVSPTLIRYAKASDGEFIVDGVIINAADFTNANLQKLVKGEYNTTVG